MRLRVAELLEERGLTAYALSKASEGRIDLSKAHRLARNEFKFIAANTLDALCDVLGVEPGELFQREKKRGRRK